MRLLYITSTSPDSPIASVDAWGYHRLALNLDLGNGFGLRREAPFIADSVRTPLYPLFLLLIRRTLGPAPRAAALIQALLDSVTALVVYALARQLANQRSGRIAALLYALNPTQVRYASELLTETTLVFLITLCGLVFIKYSYYVLRIPSCTHHASRFTKTLAPHASLPLLALLTALCILCKPNVQFLPLIFALGIALIHQEHWQRAIKVVGLYLGIVGVLLAPWIARNWYVFGRPFLSTAFEGNVSRVSAPAAMAQAEWRYPAPWTDEWEGDFLRLVEQAAARYGWEKAWDTLTERELDRQNHQVYLVARETLLRHPWAWMISHGQAMLRYLEPQTFKVCYTQISGRPWPAHIIDDAPLHLARWIGGGHWAEAWQVIREDRWGKLDRLQGLVLWGTYAGQVVELILAIRGAHKLCGAQRLRRHPALALTLVLTVAYILFVPGPIAYERFRVPVMGLIFCLIALAAGQHGRDRYSTANLF